ncbi:MAG: glycosyltransferase family 9 protein [Azospirillaceae bacterium]
MTTPTRIAVLESRESLGNGVYKLPFYRALHRAFPGCEITLIVSEGTSAAGAAKPLLGPLLARVIQHAGIEKPRRRAIANIRALGPYDLVLDTRTSVANVLLTRLFLRCDRYVTSLPGFFLTRRPARRPRRSRHWVGRAMQLIEVATGRPADWRGAVDLDPGLREVAAALLPEGPTYVGFCCGASPFGAEVGRVWPLDRFIEAARQAAARGWTPVFMIGPDEAALVERLRTEVPEALFPEVDRTDGRPEIRGPMLAFALGERLAAAVANDTGIAHLLANAGTPMVSLSGPTDSRRFLPWVSPVKAVRARDFGGGEDMRAIPVEAVVAAIGELVAAGRNHPFDPDRARLKHPEH